MPSPREVLRGFVAGRWDGVLAVPLALHTAARIAERDPEDFLYDPTQLANALRDLIEAVEPDGVPVTSPDVLLTDCTTADQLLRSEQLSAALEATRRLRTSYGDRVILVAPLPGPSRLLASGIPADGAASAILALGKEFLAAGADVLLVVDEHEPADVSLSTLANVARFHQALALSAPVARYGLSAVAVAGTDGAAGIILTERELDREADIAELRDWADSARELARSPDSARSNPASR